LEAFSLSNVNSIKQETDIYRLIDITLHHCAAIGDGRPATWACRRLSELTDVTRNLPLILDALFRLARDFPASLQHAVSFLINNRHHCDAPNIRDRISAWAKLMLATHIPPHHDAEVCWCLVVCGVFRIALNGDDLPPNMEQPNPVVFALLGLLRERGLLSFSLSRWRWRAIFRAGGIYNENWLPLYEAVRGRWTSDRRLIALVRTDPLFSQMLDEDVTFLDDRIFDAANIDIPRRVFTPRQEHLTPGITARRRFLAFRPSGSLIPGYDE
jgi:hypothetical protein